MNIRHYEIDKDTFNADAYREKRGASVAWTVLGWETVPDEDTEWSGYEYRTGRIVAVMVGDDSKHTFDPDDLIPLSREEYCGECGQIGCSHDGYDREEE
jgi:hypothetical protein